MNGIGERLRSERERLGLSQALFGQLGGVKANAQGKYEKGERVPDALYLQAIAQNQVDIFYVVTGQRLGLELARLSEVESALLQQYRALPGTDQTAVCRLMGALFNSRPL
jgi:transcriptional regulator with XRE-family HTH domain